jgi:hypothetical protein
MKVEQTECSETLAYKIQTPRELPRRKHTAFRTRRKFEIKNEIVKFLIHCIDRKSYTKIL